MDEIRENGYNLNISRYVSTAPEEEVIDVEEVIQELEKIENEIKQNMLWVDSQPKNEIKQAKSKHNEFLKELGFRPLP